MYTLNRVKGKKNTTSPERGSGIKFLQDMYERIFREFT
jgi:hypothetical protein